MLRAWPAFDPTTAINGMLEALGTLATVLIGGYLAFKLGIHQLRAERALDRRLAALERLADELKEYSLNIGVLADLEREVRGGHAQQERLRDAVLKQTTEVGRRVASALKSAALYLGESERWSAWSGHQLDVYVLSYGQVYNRPYSDHSGLDKLKEHAKAFDGYSDEILVQIRQELAMPTPKAATAVNRRSG